MQFVSIRFDCSIRSIRFDSIRSLLFSKRIGSRAISVSQSRGGERISVIAVPCERETASRFHVCTRFSLRCIQSTNKHKTHTQNKTERQQQHLPTDPTLRTGDSFPACDGGKVDLIHVGLVALASSCSSSVALKHDRGLSLFGI